MRQAPLTVSARAKARIDSRLRWLGLALLLSLGMIALSGCAPGFGSVGPLGFTSTTGDSTASAESNRIIPITPDLIRSQMAARPTTVPENVKRLFAKSPVYTIGPGTWSASSCTTIPSCCRTPARSSRSSPTRRA